MQYWDTSCPDWVERIKSGQSLVPKLPLFRTVADRALHVFKKLRVPDMIGTPTNADACGQWQFDIVEALFGSLDPVSNIRMIQEGFVLVPKKNYKSGLGSGVMLTAMILNRRPRAEAVLVAPTKEIADIAYDQIEGMIKLDGTLRDLFSVHRHIRTIRHLKTEAELSIKAADTDVITGGKQSFSLIDETHVFAAHKNAAKVFVEIRGALTARPDGFLLQITTQSKDPPAGVFAEELQIARDVRDGKISLPNLAILYEYPEEDLKADPDIWQRPETWGWVNPNLNKSVSADYLSREVMKAARKGPASLNLLASQHFNVEIGIGMRLDRWVGVDYWLKATDKSLTLDEVIRRSEVLVGAIDGGGLDDWFGLCILGRTPSGTLLAWTHGWCHSGVLKRYPEHEQTYLDFQNDGDLTITDYRVDNIKEVEGEDGTTEKVVSSISVDLGEMVGYLKKARASGKLSVIGLDPYGVTAVVAALSDADFDPDKDMVAVAQGYKLQGAIKSTELYLDTGALRHSGSRMINHCASNARTEKRGNAILVSKAVSDGKIDPLMALFTAVNVMSSNPESQGSVFDEMARNRVHSGAEEVPEEYDEEAVLADPSHPMWKKVREKVEARMARTFDDRWDDL
jgi:phage terminase large subunit-like protein